MPTTFNDGSTHTLPTGSYAGIIIDLSTTVVLTGATSTGPDGFSNWPPASFADADVGAPAVLITGQSTLSISGSASLAGGNSAAGTANRGTSPPGTPSYFVAMDGTPDYNLAIAFGAAPCVLSIPNDVSGSIVGSTITLGGPYTLTTSSISGLLSDGSTVSIALTGGTGATVFNSTGYSELQF